MHARRRLRFRPGRRRRVRLYRAVRAVAERLVGAVLAAAEVQRRRLGGRELDRRVRTALVRAVAKRLALAVAATAPEVVLAGFHVHGERRPLGDRDGHGSSWRWPGAVSRSRPQGDASGGSSTVGSLKTRSSG